MKPWDLFGPFWTLKWVVSSFSKIILSRTGRKVGPEYQSSSTFDYVYPRFSTSQDKLDSKGNSQPKIDLFGPKSDLHIWTKNRPI